VTFYKSIEQLPPFREYAMAAATPTALRWATALSFGYGLSYTTFAYRDLCLNADEIAAGESLTVRVTVQNTGAVAGDEVVQLTSGRARLRAHAHSPSGGLRARPPGTGGAQTVTFTLKPRQMSIVDDAGRYVVEPGRFEVWVGGGQPEPARQGSAAVSLWWGRLRSWHEPRVVQRIERIQRKSR
jgi:beta-glucosidase